MLSKMTVTHEEYRLGDRLTERQKETANAKSFKYYGSQRYFKLECHCD